MILKYSYVTESLTNPAENFRYHGPFQCEVEDFRKFWKTKVPFPESITVTYVKLADGRTFTWSKYDRKWYEVKNWRYVKWH